MNWGTVFTGLGYGVGVVVFLWQVRSFRVPAQQLAVLLAVGFGAGIVGAHLFQVLVQVGPSGLGEPGGRAILPGVIVGWVAVEVAKRAMGIRGSLGGPFALSLAAGEAVGRLGCFFHPCCIGSPSNVPWAVHQVGAHRHPAQLYAAVASTAIFAVLLALQKNLGIDGRRLFALYLGLWGLARLSVEAFRERPTLVLGLSPMQWMALELTVTGLSAFLVLSRRRSVLAGSNTP